MGFDVRDEDYNGTTITVLDFGSFEDLAGLAGSMGGLPVSPEGMPEGSARSPTSPRTTSSSSAAAPTSSSTSSMPAPASPSLTDARYQGLVGRVGAEHTGVTFIDITAIRALAEGMLADLPAEDRAEYEESVKPFLTPFDAIILNSVTGADLEQQHFVITVH